MAIYYLNMHESDSQLLNRFVGQKADDAFAELVHRHLPLVYSAALRQVRSQHLAEEVAQSVFVELAQRGNRLVSKTILSAWLYQVAHRKAVDVVRRESRRQAREQIAHEFTNMTPEANPWREIEPHLDEAMQTLEEADRTAVMLRFFENKSLRQVGDALGASENAAQKRITRALDRLQEFFHSKKISVASTALAAAISANAVQAAPIGLVTSISTAAAGLGSTAAISSTTIATMTTLQKSLIATTLAVAVGTGIFQSHKASELAKQLQNKTGTVTTQKLNRTDVALAAAQSEIAALRAENERLAENKTELLRLRNEVARLRSESAASPINDPNLDPSAEIVIRNWLNRVSQLKQRLESLPEANIPDLQLLTQEDWLSAVKGLPLESEADYRKALSNLRTTAQNKVGKVLQPALAKYLKENNGNFPSQLSELQGYLEPPIDSNILQRYAIVPASSIPSVKVGGKWAITLPTPIDPDNDKQIVIGPDGWGSATYKQQRVNPQDIDLLTPALKAFTAANDGNEPYDPAQLKPFLTTPEQHTALDRVLQSRTPRKSTE